MKLKINILLIALILIGFYGCGDETDDGVTEVPVRDREEQQVEDDSLLLDYFGRHYYNSDELSNSMNPSIQDLVITELMEGETVPAGHALLSDAVDTYETVFDEVNYKYYVLNLNQGGDGEIENRPHFSDNVLVNFSGNTMDGEVFDSSVNPIILDLTGLVPGWSRVLPKFNISESFTANGDGTFSYFNSGVGVMFLPSGLAFFAEGAPGVSLYSNVYFAFELYQFEVNDHDSDGVPSYREDVDGNMELGGDDTDGNILANFLDPDDDGDGVFTFDELIPTEYIVDTNMGEEEPVLGVDEFEVSRTEEDGVITITTATIADDNGDGTPDYLDDSITIDYNSEED